MSQREAGYRGGIQSGSTASSESSVAAESVLRSATKALLLHPTEYHIPGLTSVDLKTRLGLTSNVDLAGVYPDGGLVLDRVSQKILLASESKKQGSGGNAIERWFKNYTALTSLGVGVYVTTCVGDGFFDSNTANRVMNLAQTLHMKSFPGNPSPSWNTRDGSLWLYRFRSNADLEAFDLIGLLSHALETARVKNTM